jgi:hypothetical protein
MNPAIKDTLAEVSSAHIDKRRELRRTAQGVASVRPSDARHSPWLEVQLVDVSDSGFRLAHKDTTFVAGQELDFAHPHAAGTARVMWNRILKGRVETGCMILTRF